ncbi:MAG: LPS export ABC transporter permease LptF [Gammaproteobacteria bacterium]|nr:LPS export ABC transporter permease LptF [Gammaproteobacteria bacterium]MDE0270854.1 LPS export ABC transporter permease LptF [Gammaproteobacteria bacterium]
MVAARHINRELLAVFVATLLVLFAVAVGGRFIGYLQDAAAGKFAAGDLMTIMALRLPGFVQLIAPFAFYIAVLLTVGRLHAEQEMAVLRSSGTGTWRLLAWILPSATLLAAGIGTLSLWITPDRNAALDRFLIQQRAEANFDRLSPGTFNAFGRGQRTLYAETVSDDGQTLGGVFIFEQGERDPLVTVWADQASRHVDQRTGSQFLVLGDGTRHSQERAGDTSRRQVIEFSMLSQKIDTDVAASRRVKPEALTSATLWRRSDAAAAAELHWRIALPTFMLISVLIAIGLAPVKPRQGRFGRVLPGMAALVAYYLALLANQNALLSGHLPAVAGLWPAHALFATIAAAALARSAKPARR